MGVLSSLIPALSQGLINFASNAQQNHYNKQLAEYQNAFNLEMWNKQNEYNSPEATMQRLVQAGINPRAYNQLGQFANSADTPQAAQYDKKSPLSAFSDVALTLYQVKQMQSSIENTNSDTALKQAQARTEETKQQDYLAKIAGYLTADEKRYQFGQRDNNQKTQVYLQFLRTIQNLHEGGHKYYMTDLIGLPDFVGNPKYDGIRNKNVNTLAGIRELEKKFKQHDYEYLKKYGLDNRTSSLEDKFLRILTKYINE